MTRKLPSDIEMMNLLRAKQIEHQAEAKRIHLVFSMPGRIQQEEVLNHTALARIYGKMVDALLAELGE